MARIGAPLGVTLLELGPQAAPAVHALVEAALVITHDFFPRAACITVAVPPHSPLSAYRVPRQHRKRPALHTRTEQRCGRWAASSPAAPVRALAASLPTSPGSSARYAPPTARDASWQHVCIFACAMCHLSFYMASVPFLHDPEPQDTRRCQWSRRARALLTFPASPTPTPVSSPTPGLCPASHVPAYVPRAAAVEICAVAAVNLLWGLRALGIDDRALLLACAPRNPVHYLPLAHHIAFSLGVHFAMWCGHARQATK